MQEKHDMLISQMEGARLRTRRRVVGRRDSERGVTLVMMTAMMVFITATIGLAVDAGTAFVVKQSLGGAVDAAALAAGRSLNVGDDLAAVQTSARTAAQQFFSANFPSGYMGTQNLNLATDFQMQVNAGGQPTGVLIVTVDANIKAPTYFMKVLKIPHLTVTAHGQSTRRSLVMALILDKSGSMGSRNTSTGTIPTSLGSSACEAMVYSSTEFVNYFSPYDYLGLVQFDTIASIPYTLRQNFKGSGSGSLRKAIANINCGNSTNTVAALELGYQEIQRVNLPLAVNAIVLFTDGMPNGVTATYPTMRVTNTRLGPAQNVSSTNPPDTPSGNRANCLNGDTTNPCINMPVRCTTTGASTVTGLLAQGDGFDVSGSRQALQKSLSADSNPSYPSGCPTSGSQVSSQTIAYIPQLDRWGNRTWGHNPPFKDNWIYNVNNKCAPAYVTVSPWITNRCFNIGDDWGAWASTKAPKNESNQRILTTPNFFPAGHPYAGQLRPDMPNTVGAAGMNAAKDEAERIRANTTYNIIISGIYLQGNGGDPIERDFMPILSNVQTIPPLIIDPTAPAKVNPHYQASQQTGTFVQLINVYDVNTAFMQIASSLLRLSQ